MDTKGMLEKAYKDYGIDEKLLKLAEQAETDLHDIFGRIENRAEIGQLKVLNAFHENRVSEADFVKTTGYGYDDGGRDRLEKVFASVFKGEDALVRAQLISGTHAISTALFANLRPGDELLSPCGKPYDTLDSIIGLNDAAGSLKDYGVSYRQVDLNDDYSFDYENIRKAINDKTALVEIQRSRGYAQRPTFSVYKIGELIRFIKSVKPDLKVMVDNCYGEFVEEMEPLEAGADIIVGSLIKNPGGGLAPIGGYIVGNADMVEKSAYRLTAPGLGKEIGANLGVNKDLFQGLFLAPQVVAGAQKGAVFAAYILDKLGFEVNPGPFDERSDIIQAVDFHSPEGLIAFCEGIQAAAPIDSFVRPEPCDMPGYDSQVIMAAGNFISGASIELSCDGPMREPYTAFFQGGLTWYHAKAGILTAVQKLFEAGIVQ
ncbi:MAG: methionine gamma-lyase family protein [Lachnospiraceae bacterium]|nr:methionine gamma-lyase family protein [Lachnospiraceae bacterium]